MYLGLTCADKHFESRIKVNASNSNSGIGNVWGKNYPYWTEDLIIKKDIKLIILGLISLFFAEKYHQMLVG